MSDQLNYDPFEIGDRVWNKNMGFGRIVKKTETGFLVFETEEDPYIILITRSGQLAENWLRPRSFFHAVADTDEGMREAIARGEGLRRPVPRGRWPIQPGDRVMFMFGEVDVCRVDENDYPSNPYPLKISQSGTFNKSGIWNENWNCPMVIRLYDGEEPPETLTDRLRFFASEMEKYGWEEKHGGTK